MPAYRHFMLRSKASSGSSSGVTPAGCCWRSDRGLPDRRDPIQTAIANNLDPYAYLTYIFTEAPKMAANGEDWVEAMLPQNAPDSCKAGKKEHAQA
jgi:hypothetical protein